MTKPRQRRDLGPRALRLFGSPAARGEILTVLMLIAGTAAVAAYVDIAGLLARWSDQEWAWVLGELWVLPVVMSVAFGVLAIRRMRELGAEVVRRRRVEERLAVGAGAAAAAPARAAEDQGAASPANDQAAAPATDDRAAGSSEWSWEIDADQCLVMVSEQAPQAMVELARERTPWRPGGALIDDEAWVRHRAELVRGRPFQGFEFRLADGSGAERHLQISGWPIHDPAGQLSGFRGIGTDVTRAAVAEAEVRHLRAHDPMTGLVHRGELNERLAQVLARARQGEPAALLCINLDRFSEINDTLGPSFGDQLIRTCGERLRACVGEAGLVARIGGDEFAILAPRLQASDAEGLGHKLLSGVAEPFEIEGRALTVTAGIGIALLPDDGAVAGDLLKHADIALRWAKSDGPNSCRRFDPEMAGEMRERTAFESELWRGFAGGQFELHYQPQIATATRTVVGLEALLRWRHPTQGLVQPRDFLPIAEEIGLMVPLGAWVLREACARAAAWPKIRVSVNLSPTQFRHRDLVDLVGQTLQETGLAPERLELEITEGALLADPRAACDTLDRLKQLGIMIGIDDFGTGYSSLSYLQKFDRIKIARSSTDSLGRRDQADVMVHAILALGRVLGMEVCAEGVETAEQGDWLRQEGCAELQGFLFSRPLEAAELDAFIRGTVEADLPVGEASSAA
jgi:diguanylate cyclase (GGDEF)-like protein